MKICLIGNKETLEIKEECEWYGIDLPPEKSKELLNIPNKFEDIAMYRKIFIRLILEEKKAQKSHVMLCKMENLSIRWEGEVGVKASPIGRFQLNPSDEKYFQDEGHEIVVISVSF